MPNSTMESFDALAKAFDAGDDTAPKRVVFSLFSCFLNNDNKLSTVMALQNKQERTVEDKKEGGEKYHNNASALGGKYKTGDGNARGTMMREVSKEETMGVVTEEWCDKMLEGKLTEFTQSAQYGQPGRTSALICWSPYNAAGGVLSMGEAQRDLIDRVNPLIKRENARLLEENGNDEVKAEIRCLVMLCFEDLFEACAQRDRDVKNSVNKLIAMARANGEIAKDADARDAEGRLTSVYFEWKAKHADKYKEIAEADKLYSSPLVIKTFGTTLSVASFNGRDILRDRPAIERLQAALQELAAQA